MSPSRLRAALAALRWSQRGLADALGCDDRLVRRWASGAASVPAEVATWLAALSAIHETHPPPENWRSRPLASLAAG